MFYYRSLRQSQVAFAVEIVSRDGTLHMQANRMQRSPRWLSPLYFDKSRYEDLQHINRLSLTECASKLWYIRGMFDMILDE